MKRKPLVVLVLSILVIITLSACSGQDSEVGDLDDAVVQGVAATLTKQAWNEELEAARQTEEAAEQEEETVTSTPTPEPIVHVMIPAEPAENKINTYVTDFNSIDYAHQGITYGDQYPINRFERPFTVEMEHYRGYLDLILVNMKVKVTWIYVDIYLADKLPERSEANYAVELDLDKDGRGDILVQAAMPTDAEWTVGGVSVFQDTDGDVGGENPLFSDSPDENLTGYETILFEEGRGDDADLAWVRRNPEDDTSLQIAFKGSIAGEGGFLWSIWADEGLKDPGLFDYNDRFTFEEAGSPYPDHEYHPIQGIYLVDSTCRSWYGYEPVGNEIGLCQVYYESGPGRGWKLCYWVTDTFFVCSDVCMKECPPDLPSGYFCNECTMPAE